MSKMPYLKVFTDMDGTIGLLSDTEAGRLFKALMGYINDRDVQLQGQEKLVFSMLKCQIDRDAASYQEFIDKQRRNGEKGGRPKNPEKPMGFSENPEKPNVTQKSQEEEKEEDKEKEKDEEEDVDTKNAPYPQRGSTRGKARFVPPTVDQVAEYCVERCNGIDAETFVSYYEARNWCLKKDQRMSDWKAAVRYWERVRRERESTRRAETGSGNVFLDMWREEAGVQ